MTGYIPTEIRKPESDVDFERNIVILFRELLGDPNVSRVGSRGQKQYGLDIKGYRDGDPARLVGIQCKLRLGSSKLTLHELEKDISSAFAFAEDLTEFFVVTTAKDDTRWLKKIGEITQRLRREGKTASVEVWGWETLKEKINQFETAKNAFDPGFSPSISRQNELLRDIKATQQDHFSELALLLSPGDSHAQSGVANDSTSRNVLARPELLSQTSRLSYSEETGAGASEQKLISRLEPTRAPTRGPVLSVPSSSIGSHYASGLLEVIGREAEQRALQRFLEAEATFLWYQIAGVGGQGKSRLALELVRSARDNAWEAGFLTSAELADFSSDSSVWNPTAPHLIVIDYILGSLADTASMLRRLEKRSKEIKYPVRLLLLERQPWNRSGNRGAEVVQQRQSSSDLKPTSPPQDRAEWYLALCERYDGNDPWISRSRFEDGVIELRKMETGDLVSIVRRAAKVGGAEVDYNDIALGALLQRVDNSGSPLFAYFLAEAFISGGPEPNWTKTDVLNAVLNKNRHTRWRAAFPGNPPTLGDDLPALRLALLSTMISGLDCGKLAHLNEWQTPTAEVRRQALALTDGSPGSGARGPSNVITPMQPDILGEWFVLSAFEDGAPGDLLLSAAWSIAPQEMAAFLSRVAQDFWDHSQFLKLLDFPLAHNDSILAFTQVSWTIVASLLANGRPVPSQVLSTLKKAEASGNAHAYVPLGIFYALESSAEGPVKLIDYLERAADAGILSVSIKGDEKKGETDRPVNAREAFASMRKAFTKLNSEAEKEGVERDLPHDIHVGDEQFLDFITKDAEISRGEAMFLLGFLDAVGIDISQKSPFEGKWFFKSIIAKNAMAMHYIGRVISSDKTKSGFIHFKSAAAAGYAPAMRELGDCFRTGSGTQKNKGKAFQSYMKAASHGDASAMIAVSGCYAIGFGTQVDPAKMFDWLRVAWEFGDYPVMEGLQAGTRDKKDARRLIKKAFEQFEKRARSGDLRALVNSATCSLNGIGTIRDVDKAIGLFQDGAGSGNVESMYHLGVCNLKGVGTPRDFDQAVQLFQKAALSGFVPAIWRLGICHSNAIGVSKDLELAFKFFETGANAFHPPSMYHISDCYMAGVGVAQNVGRSLLWLIRAADTGNYAAADSLNKMLSESKKKQTV